MEEAPEYIIKPNAVRLLISQLLVTALLAGLFYVGIAINVSLLGLNIPTTINWLIAAVLSLLILIQGMLTYVQASKTQYFIFRNRVELPGTKPIYVMFNTVQEIKRKKNFLDKMFNTGTIILGPNIKLKGIPNFEQTLAYITQMVQYSRTQYNQ